ncbi:nucleotidyl transferase AbiEii/AbiGii toxin family protein [Candidatus Peregrinibacteria bacterium]|nr:nucleotidyl transferase AbiEii/AbiGii toxin family protein [Candidatus Peregrinibacteria bacterium]
MLNKEKHQLIMGQILKDVYSDTEISSLLGFKGGTCAYFFYKLPRFSVDLDFDLLNQEEMSKEKIFEKIENILKKYGQIKDKYIKKSTIFFLLSYGDKDHNIKIEISTRDAVSNIKQYYKLKEYLGISMMAASPEYLFTIKLAALTTRSETAMRDIYDIYYFAKKNPTIIHEIIKIRTDKKTKQYLADCIKTVEKVKDSQVLQGLGELINEKEKSWIKNNLKKETIFILKNYASIKKQ